MTIVSGQKEYLVEKYLDFSKQGQLCLPIGPKEKLFLTDKTTLFKIRISKHRFKIVDIFRQIGSDPRITLDTVLQSVPDESS